MRQFAKNLRKDQTDAENRLWFFLRNKRLGGHKFYRQFVFGPYIADFCCRRKGLIIELDGGHHAEAKLKDAIRTEYLRRRGFKVLRFWNNEVMKNVELVLEVILKNLGAGDSFPHPNPLPKGRGDTFYYED